MIMAVEDPLVSISCITYNHEDYIQDTLDGFLMQQTNFKFEILIHDDASTDRTAEIIRDYERKFPDIIKPIYQKENQWVQGKRGSALFNFPRAKGKYIALCEGDDYWTDPFKLQRQVDFLENNPDYGMVTENGLVTNSIKNTQYAFSTNPELDIDTKALLAKRQFPTASAMFRSSLLDEKLSALKNSGDTILWTYFSTKSKIKYFPVVSSVYRRGMQGIVESTNKVNWAKLMESWNKDMASFLPTDFITIFNKRNYAEYRDAFLKSYQSNDYKNAIYCLKKCFSYRFFSTLRLLASLVLKKGRLIYRNERKA